ncbi:glycosyltransferase family 4 protein [Stutzerimonas zhaodongensis]|jgi:rhamnosyl/mannosyltransferase|uniref:glycosyltransferase family 4 protein n=1 Tax=Stutzerimonas zhaodongensis TaxID=1176257 RepID=UPI001F4E76AE|nr:glycosyltransferase family 4 protein [Stutzerimonas zhaodongensis]UNG21064.1 glycosyltransferase family 4 protein [Stutzerimonas zhaodongensis]
MRVLHFFKTYLPDTTGGIEQVIFQLCEGGGANDIQAEVLTLSPAPIPERVQVAGHHVRRARQDLFVASTGFSREAFGMFAEMAAHADVVHFHFPWPVMDVVHFMTRHRRPSVVSYHSDIVKQRALLTLYRPLMRRFLSSVDRILVASPNYQRSSPVLQHYASKVEVIPYGLDRAAYPQCSAAKLEFWRQRVGTKFFLFVGVLRYYKGLDSVLDALHGTDYPLVIVGAGPQEAELRAQAERLQLRQVQFLGRLDDDDKACLLQLCHAMVFPSHLRSEAFGISLLEASMHGKPMISCEIGTGTTFVNLHETTGLAVPPAAPLALREAMRRLWDDAELASRFGANAAARFEQLFTAERMCAETARVYREVMTQHIA